ncbi:MAG TPA: dockerin type I domain-containing protein [Candidatus Hydrogenedens sp.]|nr:dockerin type I domain-containing protein [Candidatus Hydrogenedens sp.]HPP59493.1 dockerin type I domain-containing protein [Candidatus Hydrogenedens sp.]
MIKLKVKIVAILIIGGLFGGTFLHSEHINLDINNDGKVDVCDVQQMIAGIVSYNMTSIPDINGDGKVDIQDLQILIKNLGKKQERIVKNEIGYISISQRFIKDNSNFKNIKMKTPQNNSGESLSNDNWKRVLMEKEKMGYKIVCGLNTEGAKYFAFHLGSLSPPQI